jgi:hypothetical protein
MQPRNLHLIGTHRLAVRALELAWPARLESVEQHLLKRPKGLGHRGAALTTLDIRLASGLKSSV